MGELLTELSLIRDRSWYRAADFRAHRRVAGKDCWVTDILEGDFTWTRNSTTKPKSDTCP